MEIALQEVDEMNWVSELNLERAGVDWPERSAQDAPKMGTRLLRAVTQHNTHTRFYPHYPDHEVLIRVQQNCHSVVSLGDVPRNRGR